MDAEQLKSALESAIINPLIALLAAGALVVFAWGIVEFMIGLNTGDENKENGKRHMFWGAIGITIMVVAYAIVQFAVHSTGGTLPQ